MRSRLILSALLLMTALLIGAAWYPGGARWSYSSFSPQGIYRIDVYRASWLNQWLHHDASMPGFVRLYRVHPPQLLGESEVVDLDGNAQVLWMMDLEGKVSVGMDISFNHIPPECGSACPTSSTSAAPPSSPASQ